MYRYIYIYIHTIFIPHIFYLLLEAQQNRGPEKIWKSMVTCGRPGPVNCFGSPKGRYIYICIYIYINTFKYIYIYKLSGYQKI